MTFGMCYPALGDSQLGMEMLEGALVESGHSVTIRTRLLLGILQIARERGDLRYAEQQARLLLKLAKEADLDTGTAWGHWMLGTAYYEWNELAASAHHFSAVQQLPRQGDLFPRPRCRFWTGIDLTDAAQDLRGKWCDSGHSGVRNSSAQPAAGLVVSFHASTSRPVARGRR